MSLEFREKEDRRLKEIEDELSNAKLNVENILAYYTTSHGDDDKYKSYFHPKKYSPEREKEIRKWLKYHYRVQVFHKWDKQVYMQIFAWSGNNELPEDIRNYAMSLTMGYMRFVVTQGGKVPLPTILEEKIKDMYRETEFYNKYVVRE